MRFTRSVAVVVSAVLLSSGCSADRPKDSTSASPSARGPGSVDLGAAYSAYRAGLSRPVRDPIYPDRGTDALDVLHYGLDLNWSVAKGTLTGKATLAIRPTRDAGSMDLDFKPYRLGAVTVDGVPVKATVVKEKLKVSAPVRADRPVTLVVAYTGKPSQTPMPSVRGDAHPLGLTVDPTGGVWTMQEPYGAFTWYPVNDHPSDEALYDMAITAPPGWTAVASGTPAGHSGNTFRYHSGDPVASYATTLAVGKYRQTTMTGPRGIPIHLSYLASEEEYLPLLKQVPDYLSWMEKHFGPYPFPSAGLVTVDSLSAMETQQTVTLGRFHLERGPEAYEATTFHEFAHQWLGDAVTLTDWRDMWLNEGWALYAQTLFTRDAHRQTKAEQIRNNRKQDARYRKMYGPPGHPVASEFGSTNVYTCAAGMLRQLHQALGDKRFFALATGWVQDHRDTNQTRASFIAYVNTSTGHDFTALIDTWLDSPTTPPETGPLAD
ncbi:MAG TPA: M1 family metallopeptidase [Actinoplanes sp.]|nr:M1 family metallopeptidase [Actinoplanes sp.]